MVELIRKSFVCYLLWNVMYKVGAVVLFVIFSTYFKIPNQNVEQRDTR